MAFIIESFRGSARRAGGDSGAFILPNCARGFGKCEVDFGCGGCGRLWRSAAVLWYRQSRSSRFPSCFAVASAAGVLPRSGGAHDAPQRSRPSRLSGLAAKARKLAQERRSALPATSTRPNSLSGLFVNEPRPPGQKRRERVAGLGELVLMLRRFSVGELHGCGVLSVNTTLSGKDDDSLRA